MNDISIFTNKAHVPTEKDLVEKLGSTFDLWIQIVNMVMELYPDGLAAWNFPSKKIRLEFSDKRQKKSYNLFPSERKIF